MEFHKKYHKLSSLMDTTTKFMKLQVETKFKKLIPKNTSECEIVDSVDCHYLDLETCEFLPPSAPNTTSSTTYTQVSYDEDGCYTKESMQFSLEFVQYLQVSHWICVAMMTIGVFGLLGNCLSIIVLSTLEKRNCFYNLLLVLNISDSLHIIFAILNGVRNSFPSWYPVPLTAIFPYFEYPLYRISISLSVFLTVAVGMERYFGLCHPFYYHEVGGRASRPFFYIIPALLSASLVNITKFLELKTVTYCLDMSLCECGIAKQSIPKVTDLYFNKIYKFTYLWINIFATGIIPFFVITILTYKVYMEMRRITQSDIQLLPPSEETRLAENPQNHSNGSYERNLGFVMLATVLVFFLTHLPRLITSIYQTTNLSSYLSCQDKKRDNTSVIFLYSLDIADMLQVFNASVNVLIYVFVGKFFRKAFCQMIKKILPCSVVSPYSYSLE